jgi:hypothetical protein
MIVEAPGEKTFIEDEAALIEKSGKVNAAEAV